MAADPVKRPPTAQPTATPPSLPSLLMRLGRHLPAQRRQQTLLALVLMLTSGLLEMLSVGAVPTLLLGLLRWRGAMPIQAVVIFCMLVMAAAAVRWWSLRMQVRLAGCVGSDLAAAALERLLAEPYPAQLRRDRAATLALLAPQQRQLVNQVLQPLLLLSSGLILASGVVLVLLLLAWWLLLPVLAVVGLSYAAVHRVSSRRLRNNGVQAVALQQALIRQLQTSFGTTRELVLRHWQPLITERFAGDDHRMRQLEASNTALGGLPRYVVEPAAILGITITGVVLLQSGNATAQVLPTLGLLAFAAQRLLPLGQQIWTSWCGLISGRSLVQSLLKVLELPPPPPPQPPAKPLDHWRQCQLRQVSFGYTATSPVLQDFDLTLQRGEWLGLKGPSGCGKSTTLDLLLGLLSPSEGELLVDEVPVRPHSDLLRRWQAGAAHASAIVPLVPGTVRSNLYLGMGDPDPKVIERAVATTGIENLLPRPISDGQGELSSGQRQRVGIARALVRPLSLLILDEATAGLDIPTETRLLQNLRRAYPELAVVLVSHRESTLQHCDRIVCLEALHG